LVSGDEQGGDEDGAMAEKPISRRRGRGRNDDGGEGRGRSAFFFENYRLRVATVHKEPVFKEAVPLREGFRKVML
jgi:hypothetical protein